VTLSASYKWQKREASVAAASNGATEALRKDCVMERISPMNRSGARNGLLALLIAATLAATGCAKSDTGSQSNAAPTAAATIAAAVATNDLMAKLPVYPGAASAASQELTVSGKHVQEHVYTTRDSFDKVYAWYQTALPPKSEISHDAAQSQESADFSMSGSAKQQTVSIVRTGGVEVTNITLTVTSE
jgi:hypothetical protein